MGLNGNLKTINGSVARVIGSEEPQRGTLIIFLNQYNYEFKNTLSSYVFSSLNLAKVLLQ
jgi:hypothetical protein